MCVCVCAGVVEGDLAAVEAYKSSGGDIARQLTSDEVQLLGRPSAFDVGFTLVHLSIRFQRQDMLTVLLTKVRCSDNSTCVNMKCVCPAVRVMCLCVVAGVAAGSEKHSCHGLS